MARRKQQPTKNIKTPTGPILTQLLKAQALDVEDADVKTGDVITKGQALATLVWKMALGYWIKDPDDPDKKVYIKSDFRAVALLFDRMEGKIATAVPADNRQTLPETVSEMARSKANSLAEDTQL